MRMSKLRGAVIEAERFLKTAREVEQKVVFECDKFWGKSKHTSACKRASLDLSRALTELRKSDFGEYK